MGGLQFRGHFYPGQKGTLSSGRNSRNDITQPRRGHFTETNPPSGYQMNFVVCNGGGVAGTQAVYDVRWNTQQISTSPPSSSYLGTVAARPQGSANNRFTFALPVTFRTFVGPQ